MGFSALACVISRGNFNLLMAESFEVKMLTRERIGTSFYRENVEEIGFIAMMGSLANILFATILKLIAIWIGATSGILYQMILFNVTYGIVHLLPLPALDGVKILWFSRWFYFFYFVAMFGRVFGLE